MALNGYLNIKGQKQGDIKGSVTVKGHENSMLVHSFLNEMISPRDAASGLPTGKRQHKPLSILKEIDASSPAIRTAFVTNENLITWELDFWRAGTLPSASQHVYTIKLTNASIASIEESMLDNEDAATAGRPLQEQISFTYEKIEWIWIDGNLTAEDDWVSAVE